MGFPIPQTSDLCFIRRLTDALGSPERLPSVGKKEV